MLKGNINLKEVVKYKLIYVLERITQTCGFQFKGNSTFTATILLNKNYTTMKLEVRVSQESSGCCY